MLKVFIIQILFASLPVLLVPSFETFIRTRLPRLMLKNDGDSVGIAFTFASAASLLMCWFLDAGSTRIDGHLSLLPTGMGILYGIKKGVFPLVALYGIIGSIFAQIGEAPYVWVETVALLILALSRPYLLTLSRTRRRIVLISWLLLTYAPHAFFHIQEYALVSNHWVAIPRVIIELLAGITAGLLLLYSRRDAQDRYLLTEEAGVMRERVIEEEVKLKAFMETLPGIALMLDREARITNINDRAFGAVSSRIPTITREMIIGQNFSKLMESMGMRAEPAFLQALERTIQENRNVEHTMALDGRTFNMYFSPTYTDHHEAFGAVCSIYDVTEIERMRAELEDMNRLNLIGQMAAGVTHEVRNPMAVVRGYLQILQRKTPEEYDHYYKIVLSELDRAGGIIDDFLALARTKQKMNERRTLRSVVDDLWPLLQADANLRSQTIRIEEGTQGEEMPMHPGEIKQLILNLARNALEAMGDKGELVIAIEDCNEHWRLRVKDNGPGISDETLKQIRQPFFTTKKTGTGLGLALCSGIAERHGGKLSIQSTVGVGTEVQIDFAKVQAYEKEQVVVES
nr:ATP-binding protein [Saccharibacillus sp. JS10]